MGIFTFGRIIQKTRRQRFYLVLKLIIPKQKYRQSEPVPAYGKGFFSLFLLIIALVMSVQTSLRGQTEALETPIEAVSTPVDSPIVVNANISSQLQDIVQYSAYDSMFFDLENKLVYLYDSATVDYQSIHLKADFIIIDFKNGIITAEAKKDDKGNYVDRVQFDDGKQAFEAHRVRYNYLTGKGQISEVTTEEGGGFLHADTVRKDSSVVYAWKGVFTTCDLDHPHFAIRANKMKLIQDPKKGKIITGPAYLEVSDVPTPLGIPFGFFPNKKGRSSGVLIPTYGESPSLGFFLREGGFYWGISDRVDLALRGDIYSKGSWGAKVFTNYKVRYKYSGNLALKYSQIQTGEPELPDHAVRNDFFINWYHTQDPKFNPSIRFSANVNAGTSTYNVYNANRPNDFLANTFQSNVAWSKSWKFGMLSTNLRHSQNNLTHNVNMTLPQVAFTVNRFYPLHNANKPTTTWFQKLAAKTGVSYTADFQNNLDIGDSMLSFRQSDYIRDRMRNGVRQSLPVSTSMNLFKYFTLTPSATINSVTQFTTIRKRWDSDSGVVYIDTIRGARANFDWNVSLSMSTRFFGMFYMKHTRYSVIRHTVTPTLSFIYMPDFTDPKYGFYESVQTTEFGGTSKYSIFEGGIFGSSVAGKTGSVGFNLLNSFEGKKRINPDDSTDVEERVSLIDALNFGVSYNFRADHFNWSPITGGFRTKLFRLFDVNAGISADPYRADSTGGRIERFEWRQGKRIARLTSANLAIGTSLRKGGFTTQGNYNSNAGTDQEMNMINSNPNAYVDFNIPWSLNIGYNLAWSKAGMLTNVNQNIRVSGDVNVTPKWKVGFDANYDIKQEQFGYTSLNIYRDLHCWELQFNWVPFGIRQSYNLTLNVKSAVLQDLKLTRKRDWYDFTAH
jgi:hypothetical protein